MFGAASGTQSLFGGSGAAFGASSSSLFGSSTAGFGGFGQSSAGFGGFGQSSTGFGGFGQSSTGFGGFGQSSSGFGAFGQSSAAFGGFGQSSTGFGSFGQSSAGFGAFGQSSAGFGTFGQSSTAFGFNTQASGSGFGFGQPIGGASSAPGFGLSSTPAFGQTTFGNQPGFFGSSSPASSMFGSTSAFGKQPGGWTMGGIGSVMQGQDQAQHIFSREQQEFLKLLCRKDGRPLTSHTKFRDLQDGGQIALHKIEQELGTCKRLSKDLQSHERLTDRGQFQKEFDAKISSIKQAIGHTKTSATIEWDKLEHLKPTEEWLHAATHDASALCQRGDTWKKGKQEMSTHYSLGYVHKDLSSIAELPNRHLFLCVDELQRVTERLSNWLVDLESSMTPSRENEGKSSQQELEPMMQNMHAYFVHVANKIEKLFGEVDQMKREHLKSLERQGHFGNPFEEAEKERAKREILHKIPLPSQLRSQNLAPTLPMPQNMAHQQSGSQPAFLGGNPPNANPFNAQQGPSFGGTGMFGAQASGMGIGQANTSGLFGQSSGAIGFGGNLIGQSSTAPAVGGSMFGQSSGAFGLGASNSGQSLFGQSSGASLFGQSSGAGGSSSGTPLFGGGFGLNSSSFSGATLGQTSTFGFGSSGSLGASMFITPVRHNKARGGRRH